MQHFLYKIISTDTILQHFSTGGMGGERGQSLRIRDSCLGMVPPNKPTIDTGGQAYHQRMSATQLDSVRVKYATALAEILTEYQRG